MSEWTIYGKNLDFVVPNHLTIDGYLIIHYTSVSSGFTKGDLVPQQVFRCDVFRVNPGETYELEIKNNQGHAITAGWYRYYESHASDYTASRFKGEALTGDTHNMADMNGKYYVTAPANVYALVVSAYNNANATICSVRCGQTVENPTVVQRAETKMLSYEGIMMGESSVTVTIASPTPINWRVGDWIDYRNERFVLGVLPKVKRIARNSTYGNALNYDSIRFRSMAVQMMSDCAMLDYVPSDNNIHYTSLPNFSFYCGDSYPTIKGGVAYDWSEGVQQLSDRVLANLTRRYGNGSWDVQISNGTYINKAQSIDVSGQSVWDVLCASCDAMDINFTATVDTNGIGHIALNGKITDSVGSEFAYGKDNGLHTLERASDENQQIVTRLMAYGNTRNLPYRYYNYLWVNGNTYKYYKPTDDEERAGITEKVIDGVTYTRVTSASMYLPNLMLPMFRKDGHVAYVDSPQKTEIGIREGCVYFDGNNDLPDIYPSIAGATTADVWNSYTTNAERSSEGFPSTIPSGATTDYIDELAGAEVVDFLGDIPEEQTSTPRFWVDTKNLGFDPNDTIISGEDAKIVMNSGMCAGREFNILSIAKYTKNIKRYYRLTCEVSADDSINQYFPNKDYQIVAGNKFVLTGIRMPDIYVRLAEQRLQTAAESWLADNDHTQYVYTPEVDNIFMARNPFIANQMKPGKLMHIVDESLGIDERIAISHLKITEGKAAIAEWSVTMSDEIAPSLAQRTTKEVKQQLQAIGYGNGGNIDATQGAAIQQMLLDLPNQYIIKTGADDAAGPVSFSSWLTSTRYFTNGFNSGFGCHLRDEGLLVRDLYEGHAGSVEKTYIAFPTVTNVVNDVATTALDADGWHSVSLSTGQILTDGGTLYFNFKVNVTKGAALVKTLKMTALRSSDNEEITIDLPNVRTNVAECSGTCILQLQNLQENYTFTLTAGVYVSSIGQDLTALADATLEMSGYGDNDGQTLVEKEVAPSSGEAQRSVSITALSLQLKNNSAEAYLTAEGLIIEGSNGAMRLTKDGLQRKENGNWIDVV